MAKSKSLLVSARAISLDWAKRGRCKTRQINEFFSPRWQPSQDPPIHRTHTTNGANESHDPAVHQGRTYIGQNAQDVNAGKRLLNRYKDLRRSKKLPCQILWSTIARICRAKERAASPDARMPSSETPPPADKASIQTSIERQQEQIKPIYPSSSQLEDKQSSDGTEVEATNVKHQEKDPRHEIRAGPTSKKDKQQDAIAERSKEVAASEPATNKASSGLRTELHKVAITKGYSEESENAAMTADLQIGTRDDDAKAQKLADAPEPVLNAAPDIVQTKMKQEPAFKSPVSRLSDLVIQVPPTSSNTAHPYSARMLASPTTEAASANLAADDSLHRDKTKTLGTKKFVTHVLHPRGVDIVDIDTSATTTPFEHFSSMAPPVGCNIHRHYTRQAKDLRSSTVWITPTGRTVQSIRDNYAEMQQSVPRVLVEAEWVDDAVRLLLKREPRMIVSGRSSGGRRWLPMRMREESFRPDDLWEMPPIVRRDAPVDKNFVFNVRPDCSYWIWTGGFGPGLTVDDLAAVTSVRHRRALCPYLTVEVKKERSSKAATMGRQQLAASAAVALFNRCRLRERTQGGVHSAGSKLFKGLRHYGLLLAGVHYEFWCFQPHSSAHSWSGCSMRRICAGELDNDAGVRNYINWINETHKWGNTIHSNGCASDILSCID